MSRAIVTTPRAPPGSSTGCATNSTEIDRSAPRRRLGQHGLDLALARRRRGERPSQARHGSRLEELVEAAADEVCGRPFEQVRSTAVDVVDLAGVGIEDQDGFDDGIEDRLGEAAMRHSIEPRCATCPDDRRRSDPSGGG